MNVEMMGEMPEHGIDAKFVFQTGLTGSTGYVFPANEHETAPPSRRGTRITCMPSGIRGYAPQRRDSGRHHLRLIFVSLNDKKPQRAQRTQRKRQSSVFSECWNEKINNELLR